CLVTPDEIPDVNALKMVARVNGEVWSEGRFGTIHWSFPQMIAHVSRGEKSIPANWFGPATSGVAVAWSWTGSYNPGMGWRLRSGHHTAPYVRFASIARMPALIRLIARDMSEWVLQTYRKDPVVGIVATASEAHVLVQELAGLLREHMPLRVVLTPFDQQTGKIGTQVAT